MAEQKPPTHLGARGRRYWRAVLKAYDLNLDEIELLTELCRTLDLLEALETDVRESGPLPEGKLSPAVREIRQQRLVAGRLVAQLGLLDPDGESVPSPASLRGKKAADTRWQFHEKRGGGSGA